MSQVSASLPRMVEPMLLTLGPLPHSDGWSFEPKWDGFRGLCLVGDRSVRLVSRRGNDLTRLCPGISAVGKTSIGPALLDGEIVAFRDGQESFEALHAVMRGRASTQDVAFVAFDVLWLHGGSLLAAPYAERRERLESLSLPHPVVIGRRFDDGEALLASTREQGYEGVVAKRRTSRYRPGVRTRDWIKTKHWRVEEFLVGGWSPPRSRHRWGLLVGEMNEEGKFRYRARVEFGITAPVRTTVEQRLTRLVRRHRPSSSA